MNIFILLQEQFDFEYPQQDTIRNRKNNGEGDQGNKITTTAKNHDYDQ
jgi:hypothetical protein